MEARRSCGSRSIEHLKDALRCASTNEEGKSLDARTKGMSQTVLERERALPWRRA